MSDVSLTAAERRRSLIAVIASMAVTAMIYGLTMPLLALVLDAQGVDSTLIGLNTAAQSLAVFAVAPFAPRLIGALGPASLMIYAIVTSLVVFLLLPIFPNVYAWFPLRFVLGSAGIFLWVAGETWINQVVEERTRGRTVGLYSAALSGGFAIGPLILAQTGSEGWTPFLVSAAIIAASASPLLLASGVAPRFEGRPSAPLPAFLLLAPAVMLLNLTFAATDMSLLTFLPIYALDIGLDEAASLYLLTLMGIGGVAFQLPMGWLADHMNRLLLLIASVLVMIAGIALMPFVIAAKPWNLLYIFLFGGVFGALYSLGVVLLGERFRGADLASASTAFTLMWGLGSVIGPSISGAGMDLWRPHGLPLTLALIFAAYLPFPVLSYLRRRRAGGP
ncbi:MAG: MFS transporter [Alphaproteobacteria bacterium]